MELKKFAGLLIAALTLCAPASISNAADINDETDLKNLLENTGGSGEVKAPINTTAVINVDQNSSLSASAIANAISGQMLYVVGGTTLNLSNIAISNDLSFDTNSILTLANQVILGTVNGSADITSSGTLSLTKGLDAANSFTLTGGAVNLGSLQNISAKTVSITDGEIVLNLGNTLSSTTGAITISGGGINTTSASQTGIISGANGYNQTAGNVYADVVTVGEGKTITLNNGTLSIKNLGSNNTENFVQNGGTFVADTISTKGNMTFSGGNATLNRAGNADGDVLVNGGNFSIKNAASEADPNYFHAGSFKATSGSVSVGNYSTLQAGEDIEFSTGTTLGTKVTITAGGDILVKNATVSNATEDAFFNATGKYQQTGSTTDVHVAAIKAANVDVKGGKLVATTIGKADDKITGNYTQSGGSSDVTVPNLNVEGNIEISGGKLSTNEATANNIINSGGEINVKYNIIAANQYQQTDGTAVLQEGAKIQGVSADISGGTINLGKAAFIKTTTGNLSVSGEDTEITNVNGDAELQVANKYTQSGGAKVTVKNVQAKDIEVADATSTTTLNAANITATNSVLLGKNNKVTVTDLTASSTDIGGNPVGTITVSGGDLKVNNAMTAGVSITATDGKITAKTIEAPTVGFNGTTSLTVTADDILADNGLSVSNAKLTVNKDIGSYSRRVSSYTQGTGSDTTITGTLNSEGDVSVQGKLTAGNVTSYNGKYYQNAGTVTLANEKGITAQTNAEIVNGGSVTLGDKSFIETKTGDVSVAGTTITDTNKTAKIVSAGKYTQSGAADVQVNSLLATGAVDIQGGNLTTGYIGKTDNKVGSYTQSGGTVETDYIYTAPTTGNVSLSGGSFTLNQVGDIGGDFDISGSLTQFQNKASLLTIGGKFTQKTGTKTIVDDGKKIKANDYEVQNGATLELLKNSEVETINSFVVNDGGIVSDILDTGNGTGTIKAGLLYKQSGSDSAVTINKLLADSTDGKIQVTGGTLNATNIGTSDNKVGSLEQTGGTINSKNIYTTNDIALSDNASLTSVAGGLISAGNNLSITGTNASATFNDNATAGSNISIQDNSQVSVAANKTLSAKNGITVDSAALTLADGATIQTTGDSANIVVSGTSSINNGSTDKYGIINALNAYNQTTSGNVVVDKIIAGVGLTADTSFVSIDGNGSLTANDIGTTTNRISRYIQGTTGTPTVNVGQIQTTGDVTVLGGNLTVTGNIGNSNYGVKSFTLDNAASIVNVGNIYSTGNVDIEKGTFTATNVGAADANNRINTFINGSSISSATSTVDYIYASENIDVQNGTLTVNEDANSSKTISISGGTLNVKKKVTAGTGVSQTGGIINVSANGSVDSTGTLEISGGETKLADGASLDTTSGTADINVKTSGVINSDGSKKGDIKSGKSYNQSGNTTVNVNQITTVENVNIENGTLNANTIGTAGTPLGGTYKQSQATSTNVSTNSIYANSVDISGGNLTLGDIVTPTVLSGNTIKLSGGTLNLYNTEFRASTTSPTSVKAFTSTGATINMLGNNKLGAFNTSDYIYSASIGEGGGTNTITVGNNDTTTDILSVSAGAGDFTFGSNSIINIEDDAVLNLSAAMGNIVFKDSSQINNSGVINILGGAADKTVQLKNVNTNNGEINVSGALDISGIVNTETFTQTSGVTTMKTGGSLNALGTTNPISITGGTLAFDGNNTTVNAANGAFVLQNANTEILASTGTGNSISAKQISVSDGKITLNDNTGLTFAPGATGIQISNVTTQLGKNSNAKIDTTNGGATITGGTITLDEKSNFELQGKSNVQGVGIGIGNDANLNLDSTNGNLVIDSNSTITSTGNITVSGTGNKTEINSAINSTGTKKGNIIKTGDSTLDINSVVYGDRFDVQEGTVNVNNNLTFGGNITIEGNADQSKNVIVNIADGKTLASEGTVQLGSAANFGATTLNLGIDSVISGKDVMINSIINATQSTIQASKANNGTVTIGDVSHITIKHNPAETGTTISTISGKNIVISGGTTISIESGAQLIYDGNVISGNTHYDIAPNAKWDVSSGAYTNSEYQGTPGGAVVNNAGEITLQKDVKFSGSTAWHNGGAMYNTGKVAAVFDPEFGEYAKNTEFNNNKAGYYKDGTKYADNKHGGAVYNTGTGNIELGDDAKFIDNKASGHGGAIYNDSTSTATTAATAINIRKNATFSNNKSIGNGGAIYTAGSGKVKIGDDALFSGNQAGFNATGGLEKNSSGGALYITDTSSIEIGNNALFNGNFAPNQGGAVYNASDLILGNLGAKFLGNGSFGSSITNQGGAIYNTGNIYHLETDGITKTEGIYKVQFGSETLSDGNKAAYGGAIYNNNGTTLSITDSLFQNNSATTAGGAIYNKSGNLIVNNGQFYNNSTTGDGGVFYNDDILTLAPSVYIGGSENQKNTADRGGAIFNNATLNINATEDKPVTISNNTANTAGGAIYNNGTINAGSSNLLNYVNFSGNKAGDDQNNKEGQGGAIYNANGTLVIQNSVLDGNSVSYNNSKGGAIYNAQTGNITIDKNTTIEHNTANGSDIQNSIIAKGGAIYNEGTLSVLKDSVIQSNSTDGYGGAIYNAANASLTIGDGVYIGGKAEEYLSEAVPTAGNEAYNGAGIYNDNGTLTFSETSYFVGNKAHNAGGGLYNKSSNPLSTKKMTFYYNSAESNNPEVKSLGGGIYNDKDSTGKVTVENAQFYYNSADIGSAVYNAGDMYIAQSSPANKPTAGNFFEGNSKGSAIGNEGTLETIQDFQFGYEEDAIAHNAGALWNQKEGVITAKVGDDYSLYIHDTGYKDADGNGAVDGAAIHLQDASKINTVSSSTTYNNTILKAVFNDNTGNKGGAIYKQSTEDLLISGTQFGGNYATAKSTGEVNTAGGGAIYNIGKNSAEISGILIDDDVKFKSNATTGKGGAIYNGSNGIIQFAPGYHFGENISGYNNMALDAGGAIANEGEIYFEIDPATNRSIYFTYQGAGYGDPTTSKNVYNGKGGALYIGGKGAIATINGTSAVGALTNAVFTNNESKYGGAIYKDEGEYVLTVKDTQFSGNRGYLEGGAVYNKTGETNITLSAENNNIFVGNMAGNDIPDLAASGKGGAIYNAGVMTITNSDVTQDRLFVSNSATGTNGSGGAIYNTSDMTIYGGTGFYNNSATESGGAIASTSEVKLVLIDPNSDPNDPDPADVVFSQNTAEKGSAVYLDMGFLTISGRGTVTFNDADEAAGIIAQTVAGTGNITVKGDANNVPHVNFFSDASGYGGAYYQTGGIVTSKNKFLNITDSSIRTVTGGTLILDEGAQLVSDYLLISNVEAGSKNNAKIIFNENSKAKLDDLSALYDNASTFNYFTYKNTDDQKSYKVSLRAADVEINDTAVINKDAQIGNAKNSYMVRNLTLGKGAQLDANMTITGATTSGEQGATLKFNEGSKGSDKAGLTLKGYNTNVELNNTDTEIVFGGTIKNDGAGYNNKITKTGDGKVTVKGDASGYNGAYTQSAGIVEFTKGSKFFGAGTNPKVNGGELIVDKDAELQNGTVIDINNDSTFSTDKPSNIDLTGASGSIITLTSPNVTINMGKDTTLEATANATVDAQKNLIKIGNNNLQINSLLLGSSDKAGTVDVTVNPNTVFMLQNDSGVEGQGGVLGFGSNVTFKDSVGNPATPTIKLKDNTQLIFDNDGNTTFDAVIQSIDNSENPETTWAAANGDIIKKGSGTLTLTDDVSAFNGTIKLQNGEITANNSQFGSVIYDVSTFEPDAGVTVKNVASNDDIIMIGGVNPATTTDKYTFNVTNDRGNVELKDSTLSTYTNVNAINGSTANITAKGSIATANVNAIDAANVKFEAGGNNNLAGGLSVQNNSNAVMNAGGNNTVAGNVTAQNNSAATLKAANGLLSAGNVTAGDLSSVYMYSNNGDITLGNVTANNTSKVGLAASGSETMGLVTVGGGSVVDISSASGSVSTGDINVADSSSMGVASAGSNTLGRITANNLSSVNVKSTNGDITANDIAVGTYSDLSLKSAGVNAVGNVAVTNNSNASIYAPQAIAANNVTVTGTSKANMLSDNAAITLGNLIVGDTSTANVEAPNSTLSMNNVDIYTNSNATLKSQSNAMANTVTVRDNSVLNLSNGNAFNVAGDFVLKNSTINLLNGNLNIGGNYTMGSTVNMMNERINTQNIAGNMTLTNNSNYLIDINGMTGESDKVVVAGTMSSDVPGTQRQLDISDFNLLTEPMADYSIYDVFDVAGGITDVQFTTSKSMVSTPLANYLFAPAGNTGSYVLARSSYTPTAMAAPAAMQIGGYLSQLQVYDEALGNIDSVMVLPVVGFNDKNRYASSNIDETVVYSPLYIPELDKGMWFRPYGNFESVDLQDGPKVTNQTYGALVGGETSLKELGHDFQGTLGGYVGYTGAHQSFDGVSGFQNGGVVGVTGALYKGGFFSGLTVNVDAGMSNLSTPYGNNNFFMLSGGVASKTGYNWELGRGRFIIQPSWLMSYTFVHAFNPSDIMGMKISGDTLHGVQLAPGIKLMANLPEGWQPYLMFNFRYNLGDKTHFKAGYMGLPDTYVKPYVEYGLGMQKRWGEKFTGYGQFLARNGGRNGVGVNLGLRWSIGQGR